MSCRNSPTRLSASPHRPLLRTWFTGPRGLRGWNEDGILKPQGGQLAPSSGFQHGGGPPRNADCPEEPLSVSPSSFSSTRVRQFPSRTVSRGRSERSKHSILLLLNSSDQSPHLQTAGTLWLHFPFPSVAGAGCLLRKRLTRASLLLSRGSARDTRNAPGSFGAPDNSLWCAHFTPVCCPKSTPAYARRCGPTFVQNAWGLQSWKEGWKFHRAEEVGFTIVR